jgi:hypothetical protein
MIEKVARDAPRATCVAATLIVVGRGEAVSGAVVVVLKTGR